MRWGEMRWVGLIARYSSPPDFAYLFVLICGTSDECCNVL